MCASKEDENKQSAVCVRPADSASLMNLQVFEEPPGTFRVRKGKELLIAFNDALLQPHTGTNWVYLDVLALLAALGAGVPKTMAFICWTIQLAVLPPLVSLSLLHLLVQNIENPHSHTVHWQRLASA